MSHEGKMARGEKWSKLRDRAEFNNVRKEVDWMDSQESIVNDIAYFKEHTAPKVSKAAKGAK